MVLNSTVSSTVNDVELASGTLVNGQTITSVEVTGNTSAVTENGKVTITTDSVVIKNGDNTITNYYALTLEEGTLKVTQGVPETLTVPSTTSITYGDKLNSSMISGR